MRKGAVRILFFILSYYGFLNTLSYMSLAHQESLSKKRIGWEDFFEIRWKEQPKLFLTVVFMLCVTAFHSFCHIISIDILRDNLDLIDSIFCFVVCFGALMVFVLEKKSIIWKEHPFIGCVFVVSLLYLSLISLRKIWS